MCSAFVYYVDFNAIRAIERTTRLSKECPEELPTVEIMVESKKVRRAQFENFRTEYLKIEMDFPERYYFNYS